MGSAQADTSDNSKVKVTIEGLSAEYSEMFKKKIIEIPQFLHASNIKISTIPLTVNVTYKDGQGRIRVVVNYQTDILFGSNSDDYKHRQSWEPYYANFVSLRGVRQLMAAIHNYKRQVAIESGRSHEISNFDLCVRLVDNARNWVQFVAHSYTNSNGVYLFQFVENAEIKYGKNPAMQFVTNNPRALNEISLFFPGPPRGLDGSRSPAYYVYKFFNIQYVEPPVPK